VFTVTTVRGEGKNTLRTPFNVLITETVAKKYFGDEDPIGRIVKYNAEKEFKVAGVIRDFPANSHFNPDFIASMATCNQVFWPGFLNSWGQLLKTYVVVRLGPGKTAAAIRSVGTIWARNFPHIPLEYFFLDDAFDRLYQSEKNLQTMIRIFTGLAMVIACLGLFGLVSLSVEQRTKEIGIRKVVGASVVNIVVLLFKEFVVFIIMANLLAWPVIYYIMSRWLERFVYRIDFPFSLLALMMVATLILATLTMSYRAIRAARANPADALKYE
jgi:putative ABC transport system permease protein